MAGMRSRLVRSPAAPKMTIKQGPGCGPAPAWRRGSELVCVMSMSAVFLRALPRVAVAHGAAWPEPWTIVACDPSDCNRQGKIVGRGSGAGRAAHQRALLSPGRRLAGPVGVRRAQERRLPQPGSDQAAQRPGTEPIATIEFGCLLLHREEGVECRELAW